MKEVKSIILLFFFFCSFVLSSRRVHFSDACTYIFTKVFFVRLLNIQPNAVPRFEADSSINSAGTSNIFGCGWVRVRMWVRVGRWVRVVLISHPHPPTLTYPPFFLHSDVELSDDRVPGIRRPSFEGGIDSTMLNISK
jgi:hypothetical protein